MTRPTHPASKPPYILLIEGQNDKHVVGHICARLQLALSFSIVDKDGIDNLQSSIFTEINDSDSLAHEAVQYRISVYTHLIASHVHLEPCHQ